VSVVSVVVVVVVDDAAAAAAAVDGGAVPSPIRPDVMAMKTYEIDRRRMRDNGTAAYDTSCTARVGITVCPSCCQWESSRNRTKC